MLCLTEEELIVNLDVLSKEKLHLEPGDIIGFSIPPTDENESTLVCYRALVIGCMWVSGHRVLPKVMKAGIPTTDSEGRTTLSF